MFICKKKFNAQRRSIDRRKIIFFKWESISAFFYFFDGFVLKNAREIDMWGIL